MSFSKTHSAQTSLLKAHIVDIEVDLAGGLHSFSIVGLPDKAVEEARDRISAAIKNSRFNFKSPKNRNQKVVVSLAPAELKKEGSAFDLGIALAYLLASREIKFSPEKKIFLGELSLDGALRRTDGILPLVRHAKEKGFTEVYVPLENAEEAALIDGITIFAARTLHEIINHLHEKDMIGKDEDIIPHKHKPLSPVPKTEIIFEKENSEIDFDDVKGQETAKRGLEIAAAGGHNIAMYGPPGTGKTMLAKAFAAILPSLSFDDILETTAIHSVAGALSGALVTRPPFRSPHHT
ncbi:MAG TPA: magnesium chelatase domain-containing protein, partial [Candidatus Paceibacterota bacterium]